VYAEQERKMYGGYFIMKIEIFYMHSPGSGSLRSTDGQRVIEHVTDQQYNQAPVRSGRFYRYGE
jgi:hypothetical protein